MKIFGVVCEYNPFHTGHLYQLERTRELMGEDALCIAVMSGDFVQRGEAAQFSKYARAEAACRSGVNLVFELPVQYSLSSAEGFARAGVELLAGLGCEYLSFGSESADAAAMQRAADCLLEDGTQEAIKSLMKQQGNLSYAAARQSYVTQKLGEVGDLLGNPNDILGIEYIKAITQLGSSMRPLAIKRIGAEHDAAEGEGMRSASALRRMLDSGENVGDFIPDSAMEVYRRELSSGRMKDAERMELILLSRLRMLSRTDFEELPDAAGGAGQRLYHAVSRNGDLADIISDASSKRYTAARMRRMICCAALGIKADCTNEPLGFARLLSADRRGCEYLSKAENISVPILSKPAAVKQMPEQVQSVFANGVFAHDMYCLQFREKADRIGGTDWKMSPKIV